MSFFFFFSDRESLIIIIIIITHEWVSEVSLCSTICWSGGDLFVWEFCNAIESASHIVVREKKNIPLVFPTRHWFSPC